MEYDKRLHIVILIISMLSNNIRCDNSTNTARKISKGCYNVYATEINVHRGQEVTFNCPPCVSQLLTEVSYAWYSLQACPELTAPTDPCWRPLRNPASNYTVVANHSLIIHCIVFAKKDGKDVNFTSGDVKLVVDENLSEEEYCQSLISPARVTVLVAVITSVVILLVTISVGIYFLCKKRLSNMSRAIGMRQNGGGGSCLNVGRNSSSCTDDYDRDGYIIPIQCDTIREESYLEVLPPTSTPHLLYENIESIRNRI